MSKVGGESAEFFLANNGLLAEIAPKGWFMSLTDFFPCFAAVCGGAIAAATDLRDRKVYNWLTYPLCVGGLVYHALVSGWSGLAMSVGGVVFGFCIVLVPCLMGGVGPGDVKLLAGIGAWLKFPDVVWVFILAGLAIGAWSIGMIVIRERSWRAVREHMLGMVLRLSMFNEYVVSGQTLRRSANEHAVLIPFAVFIAAAVVVYAGLLVSGQLPSWL